MCARPLRLLLALLPVLALVAACANIPEFDLRVVDSALQPDSPAARLDSARGHIVHWGGMIVSSTNLQDSTRIEVLAHHLNREGRPESGAPALGRFLLTHPGYLETVDYAPGRLISAVGTLQGTREGLVGEARHTYPVIQAGQLYLWPKNAAGSEPRIRFGIGIGITR
jgi:outer membrane lipoprotein